MIYLVLAAIVSSNFNLDGMEWSFQSRWNGERIPFRTEWNEVIPFQLEWIGHSIPDGMAIPIRPDWNAPLLIILRNMPPACLLLGRHVISCGTWAQGD